MPRYLIYPMLTVLLLACRKNGDGDCAKVQDKYGETQVQCHQFSESKGDVQRELVHKFVSEGYVDWARHNPTKACPSSLMEVAAEMGRNDIKDAWGRDLRMGCGNSLPPDASKDGFAVWSTGADTNDPKDDIRSWDVDQSR